MTSLINRVPTGRVVSLHAELRYLDWRFGSGYFNLTQMKLDPTLQKTQLDFFDLAVVSADYGQYNGMYDPYLNNPLDIAGFHLTQSTVRDSQKSKSVSECANAMIALGWVRRVGNKLCLTQIGSSVAKMDFDSTDFLLKLRSSVLDYGPMIGLLYSASRCSVGSVFRKSDVVIGYPDTKEVTTTPDGRRIPLSVGSQPDSITRTRSALLAWAMTAGLIWPADLLVPCSDIHKKAKELLKAKDGLGKWRKYRILFGNELFNGTHVVERPLSYDAMTKSTKSLRERGQSTIRATTIGFEEVVRNRRFAIVYSLALAAERKKRVGFKKLLLNMERKSIYFFATDIDRALVLERDMNIAVTSGLVYEYKDDEMIPLVISNSDELLGTAPVHTRELIKEIAESAIRD